MLFALPVALTAIAAYFQVMFMQYHGWQPGTKPLLWNAIEDWRQVARRRGVPPRARRLVSVWMKLISASEFKPRMVKKVGSMANTCPATVVWLKHPMELKEDRAVINAYAPPEDMLPLSSGDIVIHNLVFGSVMAVYALLMLVVFAVHIKRKRNSTGNDYHVPTSVDIHHLSNISNMATANTSADTSGAIDTIISSGSSNTLFEPTSTSTSLSSLHSSEPAEVSGCVDAKTVALVVGSVLTSTINVESPLESCRVTPPNPLAKQAPVQTQTVVTPPPMRSEPSIHKLSTPKQHPAPRLIQKAVSAARPIPAKSSPLAVEPPLTVSLVEEVLLDAPQDSKPSTGDPAESQNEASATEPVSNLARGSEKTGAPSAGTPGAEDSPTSDFPAFEPSSSLIQSTLRGSEAFQKSEVDAQMPSAVDDQPSTGSLFNNVWADEVVDHTDIERASLIQSAGSCDMDFSNDPEEVGQTEDDEAELPPLDLDFVLQCGASSTDDGSDSRSSQVHEPEEEPPSPKALGSSIWAYKIPLKSSEVPNPVALPFMPDYRVAADYAADRVFAARLFASRQAPVMEKAGEIMYRSTDLAHKPPQPSLPSGFMNVQPPGLVRYPSSPGTTSSPVEPHRHVSPVLPPPAVVHDGKRGTQNSIWSRGPTPGSVGFTSRGRRIGAVRKVVT